MALTDPVSALFTDEWERFQKGVRQLNPDAWRQHQILSGASGIKPGESQTISIPGWDDVVHIAPRYQPTSAERSEYYAARRAGRAPNISPDARAAMDHNITVRERIRTSAQPEYLQGWGSILTALDNVQDFLSTLSTAGRLALWTGPRAAELLALDRTISGRAAAYLLGKTAARFVPVLGWLILASDLMNLLSLVGMLASPLYALLCKGPADALAAGVPTMLFKQGLKREVWNRARTNPFGRAARLAARSAAVGRLPTLGNLFEVAQTTDQLFGIGVSFGGLIGMLTEAAAAPGIIARGGSVSINPPSGPLYQNLGRAVGATSAPADFMVRHQAGRALGSAPLIMQHQTHFTEAEHLETLVAVYAAQGVLAPILKKLDVDKMLDETMLTPLSPPLSGLDPGTIEGLAADGIRLPDDPRWPVPGSPKTLTGVEYVETFGPRIANATGRFLAPRRNTPAGVFAGTLVSMSAEASWLALTANPQALRWELAPDMALLAGLVERGYLLSVGDGQEKLWRFWKAARELAKDRPRHNLELEHWRRLAQEHDVTLIKQLPPDATWPSEWGALLDPSTAPFSGE